MDGMPYLVRRFSPGFCVPGVRLRWHSRAARSMGVSLSRAVWMRDGVQWNITWISSSDSWGTKEGGESKGVGDENGFAAQREIQYERGYLGRRSFSRFSRSYSCA